MVKTAAKPHRSPAQHSFNQVYTKKDGILDVIFLVTSCVSNDNKKVVRHGRHNPGAGV